MMGHDFIGSYTDVFDTWQSGSEDDNNDDVDRAMFHKSISLEKSCVGLIML